jgi:NAD-dependent SIR2 family protein deacetylase
MRFVDIAHPAHFDHDPAVGWGFYGHRLELYRSTVPHEGFGILLGWVERFGLPYFVVTSNVDGQFQKAGFAKDRILEIHGSIHHLQCTTPCSSAIWKNAEEVAVDLSTMRASQLPQCRRCHAVARPNILMFGDGAWLDDRARAQRALFGSFLDAQQGKRLAIVEVGAGTAIPSIRSLSERLGTLEGAVVVRINPREPEIALPHISLAEGALAALRAIDGVVASLT